MEKQIHVIKGKGCDLYPGNSIHVVNVDDDGVRWTKFGRDTIHPSVKSESISSVTIGKVCTNCDNVFISDADTLFVGDICNRCHDKRTVVGRKT